jgi:sugar-specific transcriptional regulator TrmB
MPLQFSVSKEEALRELGLSERETHVWLAMLAVGPSTASEVAKKARLNRVTVYDILKRLVELGLASYVIHNNVKYFQTVEPSQLVTLLEERRIKIETILPELEAIKGIIKARPRMELYEGKAGIKAIMDDLVKAKQKVISWSSTENIFTLLQFYTPQFIKRRVKAGIHIKLLTERSPEAYKLKATDKKELRETRFIPLEKVANTIYVYDNKVAILDTSIREPIGILIENENFVNTLRILFELMWQHAEK